ncbi:CinA family protein [Spiroplasma sp. AdecLV25b]|uniref:CinA family protein n=1 Tax=Spiroplasma sp. AdecLV25b TaxID=3027162 RepID=UPI0027E0808D|nr:CinA family protein [Spiroplasma sp. AdecLV25b]
MNELIELLQRLNFKISSCESITGGLFVQELTSIAGASQYFNGGIVAYSDEAKINITKIKKQTIEKYGAVSKECALEMAVNSQNMFKTEIAISFTGNAGPKTMENKPIGLVYVGIVINDKTWCETFQFVGNRNEIRTQVVEQAIIILKKILQNFKK